MSRQASTVRAYCLPGGEPVLERVEIAASFGRRLKGLLGRAGLEDGAGLLLAGVNGVHTFGMAFPIDVLFLNQAGRVLRVIPSLRPGRVAPAVRGASSCLELAAGTAERRNLVPGVQLRFGV